MEKIKLAREAEKCTYLLFVSLYQKTNNKKQKKSSEIDRYGRSRNRNTVVLYLPQPPIHQYLPPSTEVYCFA